MRERSASPSRESENVWHVNKSENEKNKSVGVLFIWAMGERYWFQMVKFKIKMNVISEENAVLGNGDDDGSKSPI